MNTCGATANLFAHQLRRAWRDEIELDNFYARQPSTVISCDCQPPCWRKFAHVSARFEHVSHLELQGAHQRMEIDGFLQLFEACVG